MADAVQIKKNSALGANQRVGKLESNAYDIQYMGIIAKGGFNDENVEDVALSVSNSVIGGTYETYSVYVLTKMKKDSDWIILTSFPKD